MILESSPVSFSAVDGAAGVLDDLFHSDDEELSLCTSNPSQKNAGPAGTFLHLKRSALTSVYYTEEIFPPEIIFKCIMDWCYILMCEWNCVISLSSSLFVHVAGVLFSSPLHSGPGFYSVGVLALARAHTLLLPYCTPWRSSQSTHSTWLYFLASAPLAQKKHVHRYTSDTVHVAEHLKTMLNTEVPQMHHSVKYDESELFLFWSILNLSCYDTVEKCSSRFLKSSFWGARAL